MTGINVNEWGLGLFWGNGLRHRRLRGVNWEAPETSSWFLSWCYIFGNRFGIPAPAHTTMFNMYYNGIKCMLRDGRAGIPNLSPFLIWRGFFKSNLFVASSVWPTSSWIPSSLLYHHLLVWAQSAHALTWSPQCGRESSCMDWYVRELCMSFSSS